MNRWQRFWRAVGSIFVGGNKNAGQDTYKPKPGTRELGKGDEGAAIRKDPKVKRANASRKEGKRTFLFWRRK